MRSLTLTAIEGIPLVKRGDDLGALIADGLEKTGLRLQPRDIIVVCQKVVSKSEGRVVALQDVQPSEFANNFARRWEKDPRATELVLRQTSRIVRNDRGVLIVETGPGWVCANAGMDQSNSMDDDLAILLPEDPDRSAAKIRATLRKRYDIELAVLVSDTFGRPWRDGQTEICLGIAGMNAMLDLRGSRDMGGRELQHTIIATADELAGAAGLLMEKAGGTPAVLVRGYQYEPAEGTAKVLIRPPEADLFR